MKKTQREDFTKEALLQNQRKQKRYVTLTPYLQRGGKNVRVNVLGTIPYTPESIANTEDTVGAIKYTEELLEELSSSGNNLLQCELMHFVNVNRASGELTVLPYLCGVYLGMSDKDHSEQKTFIVNFDEYFGILKEKCDITMSSPNGVDEMTHTELLGRIAESGFDYSPCITIAQKRIKSTLSQQESHKKR